MRFTSYGPVEYQSEMKTKNRKQRLAADINITPFTDVILVLLVIFMITTPLISQSNIKVNLPEAESKEASKPGRQTPAEITVTLEGPVYLNGEVVAGKELKERIRAMRREDPDLHVIVRCDRAVKFQNVVRVLDPLSDLGITKLNIAATNEE